jgi:DNA (cytosine-5)-methyltransferase 1
MPKIKFIDLYAGLGGFHLALEQLGHDCVFASESNVIINNLYTKNFPNTPMYGDIFSVLIEKDIPKHQLLCGGFPCQPFSRAGKQLGFKDEKKGNHFFKIIEILKFHEPEYLLLENVETILKHDGGNTFKVIQDLIKELDYEIDFKVLSPHEFKIPHHRKRLFIVGRKINAGGLKKFVWPEKMKIEETTIKSLFFEKDPEEKLEIQPNAKKVFDIWNEFVKNFPNNIGIPGHPIWAHEWGATYEYENRTPFSTPIEDLVKMKGSFGCDIKGVVKDEIINKFIPRYSTYDESKFPQWKINYIRRNREFYNNYKEYLDAFKFRLYGLEFSYQKFEWSCKDESYSLDDKIIQFRQSGLRVSRANWAPALTTVKTQNIYFPWLNRKMSVKEAAQLQSMQGLKILPDHRNGAYKAFGNAVNVDVVKRIAKNLLNGK